MKGFPEDITEDEFSDMFKPFGEVENLKLYPTGEERKLYGFVCYVKPDEASTAREKLSGSYMRGRKLMINHYEIREIREMQNEQFKDKQDFQAFRSQNAVTGQWSALDKQEELQFYLKMILEQMPFMLRGNMRMPAFRGNSNYQGNRP